MLSQIREEFNEHIVEFYNNSISILPELLMVIIVLLLFWGISILIKKVFRNRLGKLFKDPVLSGFLIKVIQYILLIIALSISLKILGLDAVIVGIFSGAGVLAIILGFAFKDIGENFIAGMILAVNRPFKKGDLIMLGDQRGRVNKMTIRETQIKTFDGKDVFIPNANILKGNLINYTVDGFLRYEVELAVEEGTDIRQCFSIILETLNSIDGVLDLPAPNVVVKSFGSSTLILEYTFWINLFKEDISRLKVRSNAHLKVWEALTKEGVNMPGDVLELKAFSDQEFPVTHRSLSANNAKE